MKATNQRIKCLVGGVVCLTGGLLLAVAGGCGQEAGLYPLTGLWQEHRELQSGSVVVYYTHLAPSGRGQQFGYVYPNLIDIDYCGRRRNRLVGPHLFERTKFAWRLSDQGVLSIHREHNGPEPHQYRVGNKGRNLLTLAQDGDQELRQWERLDVPLTMIIDLEESS